MKTGSNFLNTFNDFHIIDNRNLLVIFLVFSYTFSLCYISIITSQNAVSIQTLPHEGDVHFCSYNYFNNQINGGAGLYRGKTLYDPQEDRISYAVSKDAFLTGLFDGTSGEAVVNYISAQNGLLNELANNDKKYEEIFYDFNQSIRVNITPEDVYGDGSAKPPTRTRWAGSTAAVTICKDSLLTILHCGDSRVLCFNNYELLYATKDHNINNENEREKLRKVGIAKFADDNSLVNTYGNHTQLYRAFGLFEYAGLCARPDEWHFSIKNEEKIFVVAFSDGIVENLFKNGITFDNQKFVEILQKLIKSGMDFKSIVKCIVYNVGKLSFEDSIETIIDRLNEPLTIVADNISLLFYEVNKDGRHYPPGTLYHSRLVIFISVGIIISLWLLKYIH